MKIEFANKTVLLFCLLICLFLQISAKTNEIAGIQELVPNEFQNRYSEWKQEFLSTEFGSKLWATYSAKSDFLLTIKVNKKDNKGAGTGDYKWDENGLLIGATISLGTKIDRGFPDPIYYPVMNSMSGFADRSEIDGNVLAATKFAHEFGHVNLTLDSNQEKLKLENKLIPVYNSIFLKNGYNIRDQKLVNLADQMGGTPTEIWENREYWGEASAMNFLLEKTSKKEFYCSLVRKINENVTRFAKGYERRFNDIFQSYQLGRCEK